MSAGEGRREEVGMVYREREREGGMEGRRQGGIEGRRQGVSERGRE